MVEWYSYVLKLNKMGEIANGIIDGSFDSITGEYLGEATGYPRIRTKTQSKNKAFRGIVKYLSMYKLKCKNVSASKIIQRYCKDELNFKGTTNECAKEIQKDFKKFKKFINK